MAGRLRSFHGAAVHITRKDGGTQPARGTNDFNAHAPGCKPQNAGTPSTRVASCLPRACRWGDAGLVVDGLWGTHTDARASGSRAVEQRSPFVVSSLSSEMSMSLDHIMQEKAVGTYRYSVHCTGEG